MISCQWGLRSHGVGTSVCRFNSVPTWWLWGPISACAARHSAARVLVLLLSSLLSMLSEIYLRLKPYVVVKISSDIVTEHCCQICILSMMFCRSAAVCWHGKWFRNQQETPRSTNVVWLNCGRPTWDMKNILYISFSHFTLTETHRC